MLPFIIITELQKPVAIICESQPPLQSLRILYSLLPEGAVEAPELARRWASAAVLCTRGWCHSQLRRRPMLRPAGHRLAVLAVICLLALCHRTIASVPTQGAAAADQLAKPAASVLSAPPLPSAVIPPDTNAAVYYCSVTPLPTNCGSATLSYTNTAATNSITLAWNTPPAGCDATNPPNPSLTGYLIQWGTQSGILTNGIFTNTAAATNITIQIIPPPLTNCLIIVTTTSATNLQLSPTIKGPWTLLNATNWSATNPPSPRYFRALGRSKSLPAQSTIKATLF